MTDRAGDHGNFAPRTRGGRCAALWSAGAAAGVLILAAFIGRGWLVETWLLWKLESPTIAERFRAAQRLGEMRSVRAIPKLLALMRATPEDYAAAREIWGPGASPCGTLARIIGGIGPPAVPALARALEETRGERSLWRRNACRALEVTGSATAIPPLLATLDDPDLCVRLIAFSALSSLDPEMRESAPIVARYLDDPNVHVRRAAAGALKGP